MWPVVTMWLILFTPFFGEVNGVIGVSIIVIKQGIKDAFRLEWFF